MSFGPNAVPSIHHREPAYHEVLRAIRAALSPHVPDDWLVAVMTGSGTLALEALCASLAGVEVVGEGTFAGRWRALSGEHAPLTASTATGWVLYETAESRHVARPATGRLLLCDAVSGWPYYSIPDGVSGFVCVSAKQLRAQPGLAIVAASPALRRALLPAKPSYLSLARWLDAASVNESPHTPAMNAMLDLERALKQLDVAGLRRAIDGRRAMLCDALPPGSVIGEGPVLTMERWAISAKLASRWSLYRGRTLTGEPQVFLWSGSDEEYEALARDIRAEKDR